jgi:hypothetical protein
VTLRGWLQLMKTGRSSPGADVSRSHILQLPDIFISMALH